MELDFDEPDVHHVEIPELDTSGLDQLQAMVARPDVPMTEMSRRIALEIARSWKLMMRTTRGG